MKKALSLLLTVWMLLTLCSCGGTSEAGKAEGELEVIRKAGVIRIGVTEFEPMDYRDAQGEWTGFDADLARAFALSVGVEAEFVEIPWSDRVELLNNGEIDCVLNGMSLTADAEKNMECSVPYCGNAQVVVVSAENESLYQSEDSLKGLSFIAEKDSSGQEAVLALGMTCDSAETQLKALEAVSAREYDACVVDLVLANAVTGGENRFPVLAVTMALTYEEYAAGFRKGSDLKAAFDEFYIKAVSDGTVAALAEAYGLSGQIIG